MSVWFYGIVKKIEGGVETFSIQEHMPAMGNVYCQDSKMWFGSLEELELHLFEILKEQCAVSGEVPRGDDFEDFKRDFYTAVTEGRVIVDDKDKGVVTGPYEADPDLSEDIKNLQEHGHIKKPTHCYNPEEQEDGSVLWRYQVCGYEGEVVWSSPNAYSSLIECFQDPVGEGKFYELFPEMKNDVDNE